MDTGPRFGDIYIENTFTPGTSDWYRVEANNAKYRENENRPTDTSFLGRMITELASLNYGKSMADIARDFSKK